MTGSALVQVAQRVQDLERATAFYSALIGSPPVATFDPPGLVFFTLAGVRLLLEREAPSALLYLRVDDLESAVARVGRRGDSLEDGAPYLHPRYEYPRPDRARGVAVVHTRPRGKHGGACRVSRPEALKASLAMRVFGT